MFTKRLPALLAFACLLPVGLSAADPAPPHFRLGDKVTPTHYAVSLNLMPGDSDFSGAIDIDLAIKEATPVIWLNGQELTVQEASLKRDGNTTVARIVPGGTDFIGFAFEQPVEPGAATLHIVYKGVLNTRASHGLFKAKQGDYSYIYTQFEPVDARRAFPCFDEPGFKVPWQVTVKAKRDDHVFSNTPVASNAVMADGTHTVKFKETLPLPSYLIAVAVGPFEVIEAGKTGKNRTPVRIITPRGRREEGQYAAKVTPQIIAAEEQYFGIPYPYEKADAISVPRLGGAMENPGLITYDESLILIKPTEETTQRQRGYASVAAHELGHQWFGDLVTMAWWNDTWLNEAFATWTAAKIIEQWKPEWNTAADNTAGRLGAESQDTLVSARKIRQPVENKNDIANAFDGITYVKGGAVIRMFEYWMGPDKFQQGVHNYLTRYKFKNARAEDFFAAMGEVAGADIPPAFNSFVDQAGLPELSVALECKDGAAPTLKLAQKRYLPQGSPGAEPQSWRLPVCVAYENGRDCQMLTTPTAEMKLTAKSCPAWVLPNATETGYYVTRYEGDLLDRLFAPKGPQMSVADKVGVLGDVSFSVNSGGTPPEKFLTLATKLHDDPSRLVLLRQISTLEGLWDRTPAASRPNYTRFVEAMYGERARRLGWKPAAGDSNDDRLTRPALVAFVAEHGSDGQLRQQARALTLEWLENRQAISPELVGAVLWTSAIEGDRELYDKLLVAAKQSKSIREQGQLLGALGRFRDPALAQQSLQLLLGGDFDMRTAFNPLLFGPLNAAATERLPWAFVRQNYPALEAKLSSGLTVSQGAFLPRAATASCDESELPAIQEFFKDKIGKFTGGPRSLAQAIERLHVCSAQRASQAPGIAAFLKAY